MNHEIIKQIVFDQHEIIRGLNIIERNCDFEENANYVLVGARRSGKSTLLYHIAQKLISVGAEWEQIIYINFEDERLLEFDVNDFNDIVQCGSELTSKKLFFFFDEIQNIDGWEHFARRLADGGERVYITGSNAKMLSKDMASSLGGRFISKTITTYDFREYLTARDIEHNKTALLKTKSNGQIRAALGEYIHDGGFPESLNFLSKREYIDNIYQKVLLGDIAARNEIRNITALRIMMKKIAETIMTEISYSRLYNAVLSTGIKVSKDSIISYVTYAEDAYLIFHFGNYTAKFAEREGIPKYYFSDNGLLNLFLINKDSALLENIIATSLKRNYDGVYYFKSAKPGIDIDFFIPETGTAIQAAYSISSSAREREIRSLTTLSKNFNESKRYIIVTYEEEEEIDIDDIHIEVIPLYKFLLSF